MMTTIPAAEWDFYQSYFDRALAKTLKDMDGCEGIFAWLGEGVPELYAKISAADDEINALWLSRGEKEAFKDACRRWYALLLEAKKGFEAYTIRRRGEALLVGRQEKMAMR